MFKLKELISFAFLILFAITYLSGLYVLSNSMSSFGVILVAGGFVGTIVSIGVCTVAWI